MLFKKRQDGARPLDALSVVAQAGYTDLRGGAWLGVRRSGGQEGVEGGVASHAAAPLLAAAFHDDGAVCGAAGHLVGAVP